MTGMGVMGQPDNSEFQPYFRGGAQGGAAVNPRVAAQITATREAISAAQRAAQQAASLSAIAQQARANAAAQPAYAPQAAAAQAAAQSAAIAAQQAAQNAATQQALLAQLQAGGQPGVAPNPMAPTSVFGQQPGPYSPQQFSAQPPVGQPMWPQQPPTQFPGSSPASAGQADKKQSPLAKFLPAALVPKGKFGWWPFAVVGLVLLLCVGMLLVPGSSKKPVEDEELAQGTLTAQWQSEESSTLVGLRTFDDLLVGVECAGTPDGNGGLTECSAQGRSIYDSSVRWGPQSVQGSSLVVAGGRAIISGGSNSAILNASTGQVVKQWGFTSLLGYTDKVAVFYDKPAGDQARIVAIRLEDGSEMWQEGADPALEAEYGRAGLLALAITPSGFSTPGMSDRQASNRLVAVPKVGGGLAVRTVDDNKFITESDDSSDVVGVVGDFVLRVSKTGRHEVTAAEPDQTPKWREEITENTSVTVCAGLICEFDTKTKKSKLRNSSTGRILADHDGAIMVERSGDRMALVRCAKAASQVDSCPMATAALDVLSFPQAKKLYSAKAPAFVVETNEALIVGSGSAADGKLAIVAVPPGGEKPVLLEELGKFSYFADSKKVFPPVQGAEPAYLTQVDKLPNSACAGTGDQLFCGSKWVKEPINSWNFRLS
ncbi:MAG: hypothetical protein HOQ05_09465 [Corynebacteriales bacterium]|nr:hypothetical protein [Mycobacteriales bacterium]